MLYFNILTFLFFEFCILVLRHSVLLFCVCVTHNFYLQPQSLRAESLGRNVEAHIFRQFISFDLYALDIVGFGELSN